MTTLKFWNIEIEADTDVTKLSGVTLLRYMQDLVAEDIYNNGGQLHLESDLGKLYARVYHELLHRLSYYPIKDYPL